MRSIAEILPAMDPRALAGKGTPQIFLGILLAVAVMAPHGAVAAGPAPVDLGSAAHFAILAASGITSTGGGAVDGDVGLSPTTGAAIAGLTSNQVNGVIYVVDAAGPAGRVVDPGLLSTAKVDLVTAYNDAAARTNADFIYTGAGNIGGMNLAPGLYQFTSTAAIAGTNVTLTGGPDDVWIFQVQSALTVGSGIHVTLAGGARAMNIFWQVGSSATLGTSCDFKGTIMADQSITMDTGCTIEGRALVCNAQVTFNGLFASKPTLAVISGFRAVTAGGRTWVGWETAAELGTVGYYLERWTGTNWASVNEEILFVDDAEPLPHVYEVEDTGAVSGGTYAWQIVELDAHGRLIAYGPYTVTVDGLVFSYETWAAMYFVDLLAPEVARGADADGDGLTNFEEYLAGTSPMDRNSVLKVTGVESRPAAGEMVLRWQSEPDRTYSVEVSTNLSGGFLPFETGIPAIPPSNVHTMRVSSASGTLYFRVVTE